MIYKNFVIKSLVAIAILVIVIFKMFFRSYFQILEVKILVFLLGIFLIIYLFKIRIFDNSNRDNFQEFCLFTCLLSVLVTMTVSQIAIFSSIPMILLPFLSLFRYYQKTRYIKSMKSYKNSAINKNYFSASLIILCVSGLEMLWSGFDPFDFDYCNSNLYSIIVFGLILFFSILFFVFTKEYHRKYRVAVQFVLSITIFVLGAVLYINKTYNFNEPQCVEVIVLSKFKERGAKHGTLSKGIYYDELYYIEIKDQILLDEDKYEIIDKTKELYFKRKIRVSFEQYSKINVGPIYIKQNKGALGIRWSSLE